MPRRVAAPKKMGPNKKALISKPAPPATSSSSAATPPTPPPPPPPPAPARLSGRRQSSLPASQQDIFDEMMGTEISSDNSNSSPEASPAAAPEVLRRKSPRFPETATATSSAGDVAASDDSSLAEPMLTPEMTPAPPTSGSSRRKAPAPKKTQTRALKEIAKMQGTTNTVIPKLPFARLIREILMEYSHRDLRVTPEMLMCLQESAEIFAVQLMEDAYRCTLHRDRITLMPKDMKLAVMLRKDSVML